MAAASLLLIVLLLYFIWSFKHTIKRWHQNRALKLRVNTLTAKDAQEEEPRKVAAASKSTNLEEPRMSVSHRASMSLRMSRLDKNDDDVENQNHRDKSDAKRLSAYSNARRKSEVAQEDAVNRDIDAAVKAKKDARRARRASMSSGADSRDVESDADTSGSGG
jgi:hypothetical protein